MAGTTKWERPDHLEYPTTWRRFEGRKPFSNGKTPKFRVQDLTDDMLEEVLNHMLMNYLEDEPLCKCLKFKEDPKAVAEQLEIWRQFAKHKMVLVCLLENKDELGDETLSRIVGCNMTGVLLQDRPAVEFNAESPKTRLIFDLLVYLHNQVDVFKQYNVTECLYALGLSVDKRFRGQGIGLEIMKSRFQLGKAVGLRATVTVFSNITSQTVAAQAGFENLFEIAYDEYKVNGEAVFKDIQTTKSVILMGARIM